MIQTFFHASISFIVFFYYHDFIKNITFILLITINGKIPIADKYVKQKLNSNEYKRSYIRIHFLTLFLYMFNR